MNQLELVKFQQLYKEKRFSAGAKRERGILNERHTWKAPKSL
jgi:hypothetical protein